MSLPHRAVRIDRLSIHLDLPAKSNLDTLDYQQCQLWWFPYQLGVFFCFVWFAGGRIIISVGELIIIEIPP